MKSEGVLVPGYVNHPGGLARPERAAPSAAGGETGHRSAMRIAIVAMRAYEQRADRSAALRSWLRGRTREPLAARG